MGKTGIYFNSEKIIFKEYSFSSLATGDILYSVYVIIVTISTSRLTSNF